MIEPKEVFEEAIKLQAPKIILVHNHPSGDVRPSKSDFNITDRIYDASQILGIQLLDHVIIAGNSYESILGLK
jgi:DNA repair protein RadC